MTQSIQANGYSVSFNKNSYELLNQLLTKNNYSKNFILVDSNTNELCLPTFLPYLETDLTIEIIEFESGEETKNIETCIEIWNVLTDFGADRKSLVINVGGGV